MARLLIINADDLGYDPAVTRGILAAMDGGIVSSATLMVNGPDSEAAASRARGRPLGLHLNLARWAPVWTAFPAELLSGGALDGAKAALLPAEVVEAETVAQLERCEALLGGRPTHLDVHKHLHRLPAVFEGLCAAAKRQGLPVRSVDEGMRQRLKQQHLRTSDHFIGDAGREAYWTLNRLREQLGRLPAEGVTELMCHPGYTPTTVHSAYGPQREVELETFLHSGARALVEHHGLTLGDFRDL
ncbi:MAG: carbohydrate deacetylase [Myxococcaceae bacterium]